MGLRHIQIPPNCEVTVALRAQAPSFTAGLARSDGGHGKR